MIDVLFVNSQKKLVLSHEVNGTMLLATKLLEADFTVDVLRFGEMNSYRGDYTDFLDDMIREITAREPKCVSFYLLWPNTHIMLNLAERLKQINPQTVIIFGGPQASATAGDMIKAFDYLDYVCTSEGENTIVPLLTSVLRTQKKGLADIPGLFYRENGQILHNDTPVPLCDLETLPQWDDRLLKRYLDTPEENWTSDTYFMSLDVGRGCPYNCTFCSSSYFWCRKYRLKTPKKIVEDMLYHYHKYNIHSFAFSHDAFTSNMKLVDQVCEHIMASGVDFKWYCSARFDCVSEELLMKMKRSGLIQIELGVEVGSKRMQKLTKKNLNLERVNRLVDFMLANGIRVGVFFMCGFPEETEQDLSETLDMMFTMLDKGINYASMSFLRFNPATELTAKHFDDLVLDPTMKFLKRAVFGYNENIRMIEENKAIFPFYYHLETPLRREFQFLTLFNKMYQRFPRYIRYARRLYNGDNIRFYRDFCRNNADIFNGTMTVIDHAVQFNPVEMICNGIRDFDIPYLPQLRSALQFELDLEEVKDSKKDITLTRTYNFRYPDVMQNKPIEEFAQGQTDILFHKVNGAISIVPVHIR